MGFEATAANENLIKVKMATWELVVQIGSIQWEKVEGSHVAGRVTLKLSLMLRNLGSFYCIVEMKGEEKAQVE